MVLADIACDALEFTVTQTTEKRYVLESLDRRHRASLTRAESTVAATHSTKVSRKRTLEPVPPRERAAELASTCSLAP
jgi:hypothetical protein